MQINMNPPTASDTQETVMARITTSCYFCQNKIAIKHVQIFLLFSFAHQIFICIYPNMISYYIVFF